MYKELLIVLAIPVIVYSVAYGAKAITDASLPSHEEIIVMNGD